MENDLKAPFDALILGAGGAGMMCAIHAGNRGKRVLVIDHFPKAGGKILISGGGRCNFTNLRVSADNFYSENPHFSKSALARFTPDDFLVLVKKHKIPFHEKKLGQLFCDISAKQIVEMLTNECRLAGVEFSMNTQVTGIQLQSELDYPFKVTTSEGDFTSKSLVVATGGLSIPRMGATGLGYDIASQFGIKILRRSPALDGFILDDSWVAQLSDLAGVSTEAEMSTGGIKFKESLLFTHVGLSGPVALQASLYWQPSAKIQINLLPDRDIQKVFIETKNQNSSKTIQKILEDFFSVRLAETLCKVFNFSDLTLAQISETQLQNYSKSLHSWTLIPKSTVGYNKAEVTRGGVDTNELSSKTMEAKKVRGLYFIGEVVDVTGWLGGYNFQWAWASGAAAGTSL